jgi:hypothetical protein
MKTIKLKDLLMETENRNKPPKGFKVTTPVVSTTGGTKWYDCVVWKDGTIILNSSGTMFESKQKAYEIGVRRSWDIFDGKTQWT